MTKTAEGSKPPLSPRTQAVLALLQGLLPAMTAVIGALWVAFTFLQNQELGRIQAAQKAKDDALARVIEAQKPFLTEKHKIYFKAMTISAALMRSDPYQESWRDTIEELRALRYSEMQMVGSQSTRAFLRGVLFEADGAIGALQHEKDAGRKPAPNLINPWPLRRAVECLADELRRSLTSDWNGETSVSDKAPPVAVVRDNPNDTCVLPR